MTSALASLLERILAQAVRPARYTGNEWNSIAKSWQGRLHVALLYPDVYEEGICAHGALGLYDRLNRHEDVLCERAYLPWPDMEQLMRDAGVPLFTLESQRPVTDFDLVVVFVPDELHFPLVLSVLALAGLPLTAGARRAAQGDLPWIVGVGPGTANPEPLAPFCDAFVLADAAVADLRAIEAARHEDRSPAPAAIYLPHAPAAEQQGAPAPSERAGLPPQLLRPIVPFVEANRERGIVELSRESLYPWAQAEPCDRPVGDVLAAVEAVLASTGYSHIELVGKHTQLIDIVNSLSSRYGGTHTNFSMANMTPTPAQVDLLDRLPSTGRGALTFDIVTGSAALRAALHSSLADDDILAAAALAFRRGWHVLRLCLTIGWPGESDADIEAAAALFRRLRDIGHEEIAGRAQVQALATPFVPRAHSPWQRAPVLTAEEWDRRVHLLGRGVRGPSLRLVWRGAETRLVESTLARGDRSLAPAIELAWRQGMHGLEECRDPARWQQAFAACGLDPTRSVTRAIPSDEVLPWERIRPDPVQT